MQEHLRTLVQLSQLAEQLYANTTLPQDDEGHVDLLSRCSADLLSVPYWLFLLLSSAAHCAMNNTCMHVNNACMFRLPTV